MKQVFLMVLTIAHMAVAQEGGVSVRGGGNDMALEFTNSFHIAFDEIKAHFPDLYAQIEALQLQDFPKAVAVIAVPTPLKVPAGEGVQDSVADNDYQSTIRVNERRWKEVSFDRIRQAIALHEFLSLKHVESTGHYPISSAYLAKFNLQSDAQILISGQDPVQRSKQLMQRESCDNTLVLANLSSGTEKTEKSYKMQAIVNWRVLDSTYGLSYDFGTENPIFESVVTQFIKTPIERDDGLLVNRASGRILGRDKLHHGTLVDVAAPEKAHYSEEADDGRLVVGAWLGDKKGPVEGYETRTELSNHSLRRRIEYLTSPSPEPGFRVASAADECLTEFVGEDEWIKLTGDRQIAVEIEKMTARVTLVNEADRAYKACRPENCHALKAQLDSELANFKTAWQQFYSRRAQQIRQRSLKRTF